MVTERSNAGVRVLVKCEGQVCVRVCVCTRQRTWLHQNVLKDALRCQVPSHPYATVIPTLLIKREGPSSRTHRTIREGQETPCCNKGS